MAAGRRPALSTHNSSELGSVDWISRLVLMDQIAAAGAGWNALVFILGAIYVGFLQCARSKTSVIKVGPGI